MQNRRKFRKKRLGQGVATINTEISTRDVFGGVTEQEGDGSHEIFGGTHLADGDEGGPLIAEVGVLVQDLARPVAQNTSVLSHNGSDIGHLQSSQHVSRADAVDTDIVGGPFHRQRSR